MTVFIKDISTFIITFMLKEASAASPKGRFSYLISVNFISSVRSRVKALITAGMKTRALWIPLGPSYWVNGIILLKECKSFHF